MNKDGKVDDDEEEKVDDEDNFQKLQASQSINEHDPLAYEVIAEVIDEGDADVKQVSAKVLDFNWIFIGNNS